MAASYRLIQIAFWSHAKYPFDSILCFEQHVVGNEILCKEKDVLSLSDCIQYNNKMFHNYMPREAVCFNFLKGPN